MKTPLRVPVLLAALICATALLAYEAGSFAYTKRFETKLLAEPKPLAEATGKLALGRKVKIEEAKGSWVRISDGATAGWVFAGNLAETKPAEIKGLDGLPVAASQTTATAAARGLSPTAIEYATSHNLGAAQADFDWMIETCSAFTPEEVDTFMQEKKKGEFQ
jgi:hypothetical protein